MVSAKALGSKTTALEVVDGVDLSGYCAVVTGGNSGIGEETVRALATAGADVVLTSRNVDAGEAVAKTIRNSGVKGSVEVAQLDLADLASVKTFADNVLSRQRPLQLLVLNAGVMNVPKSTTKDGFEMHIGVNHLGHFYLAQLLLPKLKAQSEPSRVVVVSSSAHSWDTVHLDDLNGHNRKYAPLKYYGQSKLANVLFARELAKRLKEEGVSQVSTCSLHPGTIYTPLWRHTGFVGKSFKLISRFVGKTIPQGAATQVYACVTPNLPALSGCYFSDCAPAETSKDGRDMEKASKLWELSEKLIGEALQAEKQG